MIRVFHRWPGLFALVLLVLLGLSGAVLSVFPAIEHLAAPQAASELTVAQLVTRIQSAHPTVEQIHRAPSGRISATWFDNGVPGSAVIDPATGHDAASNDPNAVERWLVEFHRSLFLSTNGRIITAIAALAMLILVATGTELVRRRTGGWRRWFAPLRGPLAGRIHVEIARVAVIGLALSSLTALWMSAVTFGWLPDGHVQPPFPNHTSGATGAPFSAMARLASTPVSALRDLTFPYPGDPTDVFTLVTDAGTALIDQGTGAELSWTPVSAWQTVFDTVMMIHTGRGAATLGLLLGLMALGLPAMGASGSVIWWAGRRARPRLRANAHAGRAETIVLVGSESGSTWGFAATLHKALHEAGQTVHTAPLSSFKPSRYTHARRILILAATYGDGAAPSSAKGFLDRLAGLKTPPRAPLSVLGFGDRSFTHYCGFAHQVADTAAERGWASLMPLETINRQSPQEFARWGRDLGAVMGIELELEHTPALPPSQALTLVSRRYYGAEVGAPMAILRFAVPKVSLWDRLTRSGFAGFRPGDLLGVIPEGSRIPRFYSLASAEKDGFVEVVVRHHAAGLCSSQMLALQPGHQIAAFIRRNPDFNVDNPRVPLLLIGAGTGVGPLAGFVRANARRVPVHLFFGLRHPDSDFLYAEEIDHWRHDGRLGRLVTAVSRGQQKTYVQDALRTEAASVADLIRGGARIMVCGGRDMAGAVTQTLGEILEPAGLSLAALKEEGRYCEDVY